MGIDSMSYEDPDGDSKKVCIQGKHVALIVGAVVVVGLAVGLGVGLTYPEPCKSTNGGDTSTTTTPPFTSAPPDLEACPVKDDSSGDWKNFRLPSHIRPLHYDLEIQPQMDKDTYNGTVTIWLKVTSADKYLWLHIRETKISGKPRLRDRSGQDIQLIQCFEYRAQEYVVMEFPEQLQPNADNDNLEDAYLLTLDFSGQLNGSLVGFYRTTYQENGITK